MPLTLKIITPTQLPPDQAAEFSFNELGGSIGRKPNNDFILLDPERFISSKHAIIEYNQGRYYLSDISTNGVFINNSKKALGSGQSAELTDGDKIIIGDFQLLAALTEASTPIFRDQAPPPNHMTSNNSRDLGNASDEVSPSLSANIVDPLALLGDTPLGDDTSSNLEFPSINPNPPPVPLTSVSLEDLFSDTSPAIPEPSPVHEPFTPPGVIPDDWDIMNDVTTNPAKIPQSPTPPLPESTPDYQQIPDDDDIFSALASDDENSYQQVATPQQPIPTESNYSAPAPNQTPPSENAFIDSFLVGVGIDAQHLDAKDKLALMEKVGRITRSSVEGLMIALRARATIKSSFRVSKTTISPVENNPLKFLVTTNDALSALLSDEKPGYMPGEEALVEGYRDLQNHQMALMAGMQATIDAIIKQFDPHVLECSFNQQTGSSFIPGQKKAKYWSAYAAFHAKLSAGSQDDFQNVFGEDFAYAYEKQINKLS